MQRFSAILVGLATASAMGAGVNYSESFEYTSTADPAYTTAWVPAPGHSSRYVISPTRAKTGTKSILADNGASYGSTVGMTHILPEAVRGTDADPLTFSLMLNVEAGTQRQYLDLTLELASGAVVAPSTSGTDTNAVALARAYSINGQNARFFAFNGTNWVDTGDALNSYAGSNWWRVEGVVNSNSLLWRLYNPSGVLAANDSFTLADHVKGMYFDRINIRHPGAPPIVNDSTPVHVAYVDDIVLTGGRVIPEPAALALLACGLPMLMRRRQA